MKSLFLVCVSLFCVVTITNCDTPSCQTKRVYDKDGYLIAIEKHSKTRYVFVNGRRIAVDSCTNEVLEVKMYKKEGLYDKLLFK